MPQENDYDWQTADFMVPLIPIQGLSPQQAGPSVMRFTGIKIPLKVCIGQGMVL